MNRVMPVLAALTTSAMVVAAAAQTPVGTGVTYQGELRAGGAAANGLHDFRFRLYDAAAGGAQVGSDFCADNVSVIDGVFSVLLDFGPQFNGYQRFLEIEVRADSGLDCTSAAGFVVLSSRQSMTATPYALFALGADGANIANLNASNLATGAVADGRLSSNVDLLNAAQIFTGVKSFAAAPSFTAVGAPFSVTSATMVTNLNADLLDGLHASAFLQAVPNPLTLSGSSTTHIILGENTFAGNGASAIVGRATGATGMTFGGNFETTSTSGRAVFASANAATGTTYGGYFHSASTSGRGVFGEATAATGSTFGVHGESNSTAGVGVFGEATHPAGLTHGGRFESASTSGTGVRGTATAATGGAVGVHGTSAASSGAGVVGAATAATGIAVGVQGSSAATSGAGVVGAATAASGGAYGVIGSSTSTSGRGVYGFASASTGLTYGGYFFADSTSAIGVFSYAVAGSGDTTAVWGRNNSTSGRGVYGHATASTGTTYGVHGVSDSNGGSGVFGQATSVGVAFAAGGRFESASPGGGGILALATDLVGPNFGGMFVSDSDSGTAIYGQANADSGTTYGGRFESDSTAGRGVFGEITATTGTNYGGRFETASTAGRGALGYATAITGGAYGVYGRSDSTSGRGVYGFAAANSGTIYGVYGEASTAAGGYAVFADGDMGASGLKPFRIDHPDDPANRYLLHYAAESPDVINFYSGKITLNGAGEAVVDLPLYFAKINKDPRYTLTAIGAAMPSLHIAEEISELSLEAGGLAEPDQAAPACWFRIAGGVPGMRVSWEVKAVRNDRWARQRGAPVEVDKQDLERGTYQHPELYGQPATKALGFEQRNVDQTRSAKADVARMRTGRSE